MIPPITTPSRHHRQSLSISIPAPMPLPTAPTYGFTDSSLALTTSFTSASTLHTNQLIILKSRPCRILTITSTPESTSTFTPISSGTATPLTPTISVEAVDPSEPIKPVRRKPKRTISILEVTAQDIFTEAVLSDRLRDSDQVQVPVNVREEEYLLADIEGGNLVLWGDDGVERKDVRAPLHGDVADGIRRLLGEGKEGWVKVRGWGGESVVVGLTEE
ncbi:hypothetical protein BJ508DRAFT_417855 [Ascobolus immersus RN42]|uniref:Translation initiation factor 5A C-terminal domain-containing protein n=1 Tax=Ascobolus immersus RN42 TaxID=1160509 RepID=A0A3N4HQ45_ASCIM|nr:hypothetical protein BJ508DRAFT_417855 [Ascobolus immersus RN42]